MRNHLVRSFKKKCDSIHEFCLQIEGFLFEYVSMVRCGCDIYRRDLMLDNLKTSDIMLNILCIL